MHFLRSLFLLMVKALLRHLPISEYNLTFLILIGCNPDTLLDEFTEKNELYPIIYVCILQRKTLSYYIYVSIFKKQPMYKKKEKKKK